MNQKMMELAPSQAALRLPVASRPLDLNFIPSKWAEMRHETVDRICTRFSEKPSTVFIFKDTKLHNDELALIRKDHLENLMKLSADLSTGEAAIKQSMESVVTAVDMLISTLKQSGEIKIPKNSLVDKALRMVTLEIKSVFKSTVLLANEPKDKPSVPLSDEENVLFNELLASENENDNE